MTRDQINQLDMMEAVALFFKTYADRLSGNPKIAALAATLAIIIKDIRDAKQIQDKTTEAESMTKMDLQEKIISTIIDIGVAMRAYADNGENTEVYAVANFNDSEIRALRNSDLADKARTICNTAKPVVENLMNVTPENISKLETYYKAYLEARPEIDLIG